MALMNPYINFNGNAEEAFNFYKSVFGGEFAKIMRFTHSISTHAAAASASVAPINTRVTHEMSDGPA